VYIHIKLTNETQSSAHSLISSRYDKIETSRVVDSLIACILANKKV
jgi:hypothetical protein